jgi:gamma-glutamyltranspeptidase/glutathione hydrolase
MVLAAGQSSSTIPVGAIEPSVGRIAVTGVHGAVACAGSVAPSVGLKVLMDDGNAIDAAIATEATVTVTTSYMCGIGGHGTMVVYWAETGEVMALDFGTGVPKAFDVSRWGTPLTYPAETDVANTVLLATLAGWAEALDKLGTTTLAEALQPAIPHAEDGIPVNSAFVHFMSWYDDLILNAFPKAAKMFMPKGRAPKEGEILKFPDLAATYRLIAEKGPDVFYKGGLGDKVLAYLNEQGSMFTKEEFVNYKPIWREVLSTTYRDEYEVSVIENQDFSPVILTMFNIWENFDMQNIGAVSADELHLILETGKAVLPHKAAYYGDPDFDDVPYDILTSKEYAAKCAAEIDMSVAGPEKIDRIQGPYPTC